MNKISLTIETTIKRADTGEIVVEATQTFDTVASIPSASVFSKKFLKDVLETERLR